MIKSASVDELKKWLESGDAVLVDVRNPDEHAQACIVGSVLLPVTTITADALPPFQGKKLVLHCGGGGRSRTACGKIKQEKQDIEIYNLEGGFRAWKAAGYPVKGG